MAVARGIITVTDTSDGLPSVTIFQSNENHSFTTPSTGALSDFSSYFNDITVRIGDTQAEFVTTTPTANNTYTIGNATVTPTGGITGDVDLVNAPRQDGGGNINIARHTITAYQTAVNDVVVSYPVVVRSLNANRTFIIQISFSKSIGGSAETLQVSASRQSFLYTNAASTTASADGDVTLTAVYDGPDTGSFTWTRSVDGGADQPVSGTTGTQIITAADFNTAGAGNTPANFITYRVSRSNVTDRVSVYRVNSGDASFFIVGRVTSGTSSLKNNDGSVTFVADLFQGANQITDLTGWSFQWEGPPANDHDGDLITLSDSTTGITLSNFAGGVDAQIVIDADYIENDRSASINVTGTDQ